MGQGQTFDQQQVRAATRRGLERLQHVHADRPAAPRRPAHQQSPTVCEAHDIHVVTPVPPPAHAVPAARAEPSGCRELSTQIFVRGGSKMVEVRVDATEHRIQLARLEAGPSPPDVAKPEPDERVCDAVHPPLALVRVVFTRRDIARNQAERLQHSQIRADVARRQMGGVDNLAELSLSVPGASSACSCTR